MEESNSFCHRNRLNTALQFGGYCSEDYVKLNLVSQLGEKTKQNRNKQQLNVKIYSIIAHKLWKYFGSLGIK